MAHTLSVPPRSNLPSMSHLPFQEMDNALAPAHLCALFGGVLGLNFRIWWTNMAIEIPHFSLGDTSSQGPCSAALLVYERVSFLRVLLPSKNDGWGEIHADYSHFWRKKHPERWYLLAYRYLNDPQCMVFCRKIWQHMAYKTGDFEILKFLPYGLMDWFFGEQMDGIPKPASLVTTGD